MKVIHNLKSFGNRWMAFGILAVGLGLTTIATIKTDQSVKKEASDEFTDVCNEIATKIHTRLHSHALLLRTVASFFEASDTITREDWKRFVEHSKIAKNLPGIQGVGFSLIIQKNQLQQHIRRFRNEGFPNYEVYPVGERDVYTSIIYLEPFSGRNLRAFSYDMFSEPVRRKAMEISRDSDISILSGKVLLVQETTDDIQPGTLMYVPVYRRAMPVSTIQERRAAIVGWVYSPYHMKDLMQGIMGRWDLMKEERIQMQVYDDSITASALLYNSQTNDSLTKKGSHDHTFTLPIDFNGKTWVLLFTKNQGNHPFYESKAIIVFIGGFLISILLFAVFLLLINTKNKAEKIAEELTAELKQSETKFRMVADYAYDWEYWEGTDNRLLYVSPSCERISGYKPDEFLSDIKLLQKIIHPGDLMMLDKHFEIVHSSADERIVDEIDFRIIKKDGTVACIGHLCTPVFDDKGTYLCRRISNRDITERKLAEELLLHTRKNYETFFNTIDDLLFVLDEHGNIIHTNSTVINRLGYTREELSGQSVLMVHPPERREEAGRIVGEMLQGLAGFCPVPVLTKSGVQIPVETKVTAGFWDGKPVIFGVTKDISKLELSEEKFSRLFHLNPSACGLSDLETHQYIEVNEAFFTLFGFDKNEVIGKTPEELGILTDETRKMIIHKANSNGNVTNVEADLRTRNGSIKHTLLSSENIYVQDKKYRFTVVHDITDLKHANNAVAASETRFRRLFESAKDGILILDAVTGMIADVNPFLIRLLGYSKEQFIKKTIWEIGFFKDIIANQEKFTELQQNEYIRYENLPLETAFGKRINVEFISNLYLVNQQKVIQCNIRDITERRLAEEALKKNEEELRHLNATKDKFFSIIAHDLKSPFNSIMGFSELLVEQVSENNLDGIAKYSGIILNSSKRALDLLMNLLDWSRSQTGRMEFMPEDFEMVEFIQEISLLFNDIASQKTIAIKKELPHNATVFADKAMISTVLRNLISNAIKFTKPGGEITISALEKPDELLITVSDSGVGIPREMIGKLFRIDENYTTSGTNNERGTGLGLILCKEFIEKHHGKIWVESIEENQSENKSGGSTFFFTLPGTSLSGLKKESKKADQLEVTPQSSNSKTPELQVLIVEDDMPSEMLMDIAVKIMSKEIIKVNNGIAAIEAFHKNPDINLILMDIHLPGMDGFETTQQIRQFNKQVIIIAQTAFVSPGLKERALAAGYNDYLAKPFKKDELIGLIQKHFK